MIPHVEEKLMTSMLLFNPTASFWGAAQGERREVAVLVKGRATEDGSGSGKGRRDFRRATMEREVKCNGGRQGREGGGCWWWPKREGRCVSLVLPRVLKTHDKIYPSTSNR